MQDQKIKMLSEAATAEACDYAFFGKGPQNN